MIGFLLLAGIVAFQYSSISQLSNTVQLLLSENQHLLSYGMEVDRVPNFIQNITKINTTKYTISLLSNTIQWRSDFGGVAEEVIQYSLTSSQSNLNIDFRFRNSHFSRYQLVMIESSPIFTQTQPNDVLQNARGTLARYKAYSGDTYLNNMSNLLDTIAKIDNTMVTQGNIKLQISVSGDTVVFFWMHTENGIDYQAKGLQLIFQDNVLTTMSDGYFLFTIGNTELTVSREQAINVAKNYVKTLTWAIEGKQVSGFNVVDPPLSVQLVPHTRGSSAALIPYWYVQMSLDKTYGGGINEVAIGVYADRNQVADVQMLSTSVNTET
jgi:hypothetical protein